MNFLVLELHKYRSGISKMTIDHSHLSCDTISMEKISVSEFKAVCLRLLREVNASGKEILITKDGKDLAIVGPPRRKAKAKRAFGALKDDTEIKVDLSQPLLIEEWELLK